MECQFLKYFLVAALSCCLFGQAQAQTMDYGSLEALFGEPVTTSATGNPQRASDVPVTMEIITADDIRRSGAINVPGVLSKLSGMSVWQWGRTQEEVSIRGYNQAFSPRILVLVNGRQVYHDDYGYTIWPTVPAQLSEIRQIEVVKGPNSALFGFNAVSGVINIITYNPLYDNISNAGVSIGTNNYKEGHVVYTVKPTDKIGIRFSAGGTKADEFQKPTGAPEDFDPAQYNYSFDSVSQVTDDSQLRIELSQSWAKLTEYIYVYVPYNAKYYTKSAKVAYTANTNIGIMEMGLYRNWMDLDANGPFSVELRNEVTVAQIKNTFQLGNNHRFRLQGEYRHNVLDSIILDGVIVPSSEGNETSYNNYAGSAMWNWTLRDSLVWTNAVRVDHLTLNRSGFLPLNAAITSNDAFDTDMTEYSYNSGLVWNVTEKDTMRLMTARGVQSPSLLNFGIGIAGAITFIGNPDTKAAIVTNYELEYSHKIDSIDGSMQTSLFYQETEDLIGSRGAVITGLTQQPGNIGSTHIVGLETEIKGALGPSWTWDANYTLQKATDDLSVNQGGDNRVPYNGEEATPTHTLNVHVGYAEGPWEIDAYAQYVSPYQVLLFNSPTFDPVDIDGSINVSGRAGYKINDQFTVSLSGAVLNHDRVRATSGPQNERQIFLSLAASF